MVVAKTQPNQASWKIIKSVRNETFEFILGNHDLVYILVWQGVNECPRYIPLQNQLRSSKDSKSMPGEIVRHIQVWKFFLHFLKI